MALTNHDTITMPIAELLSAPYNPRKISKKALAGLKKSIERFGVVQPVVWNRRSRYVVGGHQRLLAMAALGYVDCPVVVVDLDESNERALNVALNSQAISGAFTDDIAKLIESIQAEVPSLADDLLLSELVKNTTELAGDLAFGSRFEVVVTVDNETDQRDLYEEMIARGYNVKVLTQ